MTPLTRTLGPEAVRKVGGSGGPDARLRHGRPFLLPARGRTLRAFGAGLVTAPALLLLAGFWLGVVAPALASAFWR